MVEATSSRLEGVVERTMSTEQAKNAQAWAAVVCLLGAIALAAIAGSCS